MAGRTTMAIAHRLSTIQDMDEILVLHKGVLREAALTSELLAARGIYYKLFELQYRAARIGGRAEPLSDATSARNCACVRFVVSPFMASQREVRLKPDTTHSREITMSDTLHPTQ
ncbi:MAG: hypothetical protein QM736_05565 [Vicinamibacterales bacterium]